jgi:hypothetical protein
MFGLNLRKLQTLAFLRIELIFSLLSIWLPVHSPQTAIFLYVMLLLPPHVSLLFPLSLFLSLSLSLSPSLSLSLSLSRSHSISYIYSLYAVLLLPTTRPVFFRPHKCVSHISVGDRAIFSRPRFSGSFDKF